jgi:hypothetical protein
LLKYILPLLRMQLNPNKRLLFLATLIFLSLTSCYVFSPFRKSPYKMFVSNVSQKPFDLIIVPGVPFNGKSWSKVMRDRIYWSKFLFDKGITKNIMYSGGAVHTPYIESKIMGLYAEALGIPKSNIFTEEKAEHTTENVYYSYKLAQEKGFKKIALATDPYQTNNLHGYLKKNAYDISLLPIQYDTVYIMNMLEPKIVTTSAQVDSATFLTLKKRESFFKRTKGTMGKNITK